MLRRITMWAFALTAVLAGGAAAAGWLQQQVAPNPEPRDRQLVEVPQTASADAEGIRLDVLGAVFSGTETRLRAKLTVSDPALVKQRTGGAEVRSILPALDGFDGGFAGNVLSARAGRDGSLLVELPPVVPARVAEGRVPFVLRAVTAQTSGGEVRLAGSWDLGLSVPGPREFAEALRVEALPAATVMVRDHAVGVSGQRSTSETRVAIVLPSSLTALSQPVLVQGTQRFVPYRVERRPDGLAASFPPTSFGRSVQVELGPMAVASAGQATRLTVAVGQAMLRTNGGSSSHTRFAVGAGDILAGNAGIVISGNRGAYGAREWVSLNLQGNWLPENGEPTIFDGRGNRLELAHVQVGYTKDLAGNIGPGETDVAAFVGDPSRLDQMTIIMGPESSVDRGPYRATLDPRIP